MLLEDRSHLHVSGRWSDTPPNRFCASLSMMRTGYLTFEDPSIFFDIKGTVQRDWLGCKGYHSKDFLQRERRRDLQLVLTIPSQFTQSIKIASARYTLLSCWFDYLRHTQILYNKNNAGSITIYCTIKIMLFGAQNKKKFRNKKTF